MGINILIVDDSDNIRAFIKKALSLTELDINQILEAENGLQGLEKLSAYKIDIILSDINMPVMDGLEFIRNVRAEEKNNEIIILVVSTEGSRQMILESVKAGANGYLKKPFGPDEVMETLERIGKV